MDTEINSQILRNALELMTNRDDTIKDEWECTFNQLMSAALTNDYSLINIRMSSNTRRKTCSQ